VKRREAWQRVVDRSRERIERLASKLELTPSAEFAAQACAITRLVCPDPSSTIDPGRNSRTIAYSSRASGSG
jgi:hypothetical protein